MIWCHFVCVFVSLLQLWTCDNAAEEGEGGEAGEAGEGGENEN